MGGIDRHMPHVFPDGCMEAFIGPKKMWGRGDCVVKLYLPDFFTWGLPCDSSA